jgi:16S rRNA (cytidine1402-2'-O)-methyltransferase
VTGGSSGGSSGGRLFVVATPIGNLGDVTLRALEVLRAVPLIAAEDTRVTRRLLERHAVETRTISYHARSGPGRVAELLVHLRRGEDLALVTDAGTPGVSDPGGELVAAWAGEGGTVVPIPGPSAVLSAVVASGIAGPRWAFEGFLPRSGRERRERIARIAADERGTVVYEAPSRVVATLRDLAAACGPDRPAAICRELTKLHEEVRRGGLGELAAWAAQRVRGEICIVVGGAAEERADAATALDRVLELAASGTRLKDAAALVAAESGLGKRDLYEAALASRTSS